jgi:membrane protease YdiL (CAAX protease family)
MPEIGDVTRDRPGPRGFAVAGWVGIALGCAILILLNVLSIKALDATGTDINPVLELQGKYIVGVRALTQVDSGMLYTESEKTLNVGSVDQRLCFVVLAAELVGPDQAIAVLDELDQKIEFEQQRLIDEGADPATVLTPEQREVMDLLRSMYDVQDNQWSEVGVHVNDLPATSRMLLSEWLGWFGELAVAPPLNVATPQRREIMASANIVLATIIAAAVVIGGLGVCGFIGLIVLVVLMFGGRVRSGVQPGRVHHGIYAETFGIWMLLFPMGQVGAAIVGAFDPDLTMPALIVVSFASLLVLLWPVLRGARWRDVRADIGWTLGRQPAAEPLLGVVGYAMALPMLAIGLGITLVLMLVQMSLMPPASEFDPAGGPAHPIIFELTGPAIMPKLWILALAAIAAPIVEETMFRGVLYRHLRDASRRSGQAVSVILSAAVSGFIFAAIHPQGWVAIPALMSLSFGFVLVREWRGTLIPAMLIHGISNFLVMSITIIVLSV